MWRSARPSSDVHQAGRPIEVYVVIDPPPKEDRALREWLELAVPFVQTLPAKSLKSSPRQVGATQRQVQNAAIISNKMPAPPKPHGAKAGAHSRRAAVPATQSRAHRAARAVRAEAPAAVRAPAIRRRRRVCEIKRSPHAWI
jgi:hypothetical protein